MFTSIDNGGADDVIGRRRDVQCPAHRVHVVVQGHVRELLRRRCQQAAQLAVGRKVALVCLHGPLLLSPSRPVQQV